MVSTSTRARRFAPPDAEALALCGTAALGALSVLLDAPAALRGPGGILLFAVLPGALLARLLRAAPSVRLEDWLLQVLTLSPPIVIAARVIASAGGLGWDAFAVAMAALVAGATLASPVVRVTRVEADRRVLGIALALGVAAALPALVDIRTRVFGDALVHAQIVHEILLRGLPPQDPSFAGVQLTYMWLLHVWWAALSFATGLTPFFVFPLANGVMAVALVMAARLGAEALGGGRPAQRWAALAVPLGMNALGWIPAVGLTVVRSLVGDDRGSAALVQGLRGLVITPDANAVSGALIPRGYFVLASFLYKYFCANALATALAYVAAAWAWAAVHLRAPRLDRAVVLAISVLGATTIHPMVGVPAALALFSGLAATLLDATARRRAASTTLAAGIGLALALPVVHALIGGAASSQDPLRVGPVVENAVALPLVLVAVFPAAAWVWFRRRREERAHARFALAYAVAAALFALVVRMPFLGYAYPVYVVYLACALPAGEGFARLAASLRERRGPAVAWMTLAVLLAPTALLEFNAFLRQGHPGGLAGYPENADQVRVYDFLRTRTPVDAVIVDLPFFASSAAAGYSGRRGLFGGLRQADLVGYPHATMSRRLDAVTELYYGRGALSAATRSVLRETAAEVFVVAHRTPTPNPSVVPPAGAATDAVERLDALAGEFEPLLRTAGMAVYRWRPR